MPRPSTVVPPCAARRPQQRRVERVVHEVGHDLAGVQQPPGRAAARRRSPMPTDVALHDEVGAGDVGDGPPTRPASPASAAAAAPLLGACG